MEQAGTAGTAASRPEGAPLALIADWLSPLAGRRVLDVGCGSGALARDLAALGARVSGVDPLAEAVAAARVLVPEGAFMEAGAEALPFADGAFDAAVLLNSFHHVPPALMSAALDEAMRVTRGPVLVVEPLAEGPFFEVMRPVEDETDIRRAAQAVIAGHVTQGRARLVRAHEFDDVRRFADVDAFLAKVVAVDPARAEAARALRGEVEALMARWGRPEGAAIRLDQPHRAVLLARPEGDRP